MIPWIFTACLLETVLQVRGRYRRLGDHVIAAIRLSVAAAIVDSFASAGHFPMSTAV